MFWLKLMVNSKLKLFITRHNIIILLIIILLLLLDVTKILHIIITVCKCYQYARRK